MKGVQCGGGCVGNCGFSEQRCRLGGAAPQCPVYPNGGVDRQCFGGVKSLLIVEEMEIVRIKSSNSLDVKPIVLLDARWARANTKSKQSAAKGGKPI